MDFMHASGDTRQALRADLASCGYFPELVEDTVLLAVGAEEVIDFVVHHEPTFNHDEVRRHLTVLVLTPTRLVVGHTDEQPADTPGGAPAAATSAESIGLAAVHTVALTRVITQPEKYHQGDPAYEAWLSAGWSASPPRCSRRPAAVRSPPGSAAEDGGCAAADAAAGIRARLVVGPAALGGGPARRPRCGERAAVAGLGTLGGAAGRRPGGPAARRCRRRGPLSGRSPRPDAHLRRTLHHGHLADQPRYRPAARPARHGRLHVPGARDQ